MKAEVAAWIKGMLPSVDIDSLGEEEITRLEANYEGRQPEKPKRKLDEEMDSKAAEVARVDAITDVACKACDSRPYDIAGIKKLATDAIEGKWTIDKFRLELLEASVPPAHSIFSPKGTSGRLTQKVVEAAIAMAGRLKDHEKMFDDQTLQAAHDRFKNGIGLKQLWCLAAEANGYKTSGNEPDLETQRAAFGQLGGRAQIHAAGFSTFSLPNALANNANKFLREGWFNVDQTPLRLAAIRPVRDFKQISTVSLTGGMLFKALGPDGELKHAELGEVLYNNQASTAGIICQITRTDIINDDLNALTAVPRRIGRGGMLYLNYIFWTTFLNNSAFFAAGNNNVSTGAGSAFGQPGLSAAEQKFAALTDPDGYPVATSPAILLVPPTLAAAGRREMNSEILINVGANTNSTQGSSNPFQGRYRVESSPYMENSNFTGNSTAAWYLLADPNDVPVIEIAALNGRVEPTVETADAEFSVLGVQMRGYSDVGVALQEKRGGIRSAGS